MLRRYPFELLLILVGCVGLSYAGEEAKLPKDVQRYIGFRAGCNHLAGEDLSDPKKAKRVADLVNQCKSVDNEEKRLREKYQANQEIVEIIDTTHDIEP